MRSAPPTFHPFDSVHRLNIVEAIVAAVSIPSDKTASRRCSWSINHVLIAFSGDAIDFGVIVVVVVTGRGGWHRGGHQRLSDDIRSMINRRQLRLQLLALRRIELLLLWLLHLLNTATDSTPVHVHIGRRGGGRIHLTHLNVELLLLAVSLAASQIAVAITETRSQLGATQL